MKENKTVIIASITGLIIIGFLFYNQHTIKQENIMLRELMGRQASGDKKQTDPYIAGPVKNQIIKGTKDLKVCYKEYLAKNPKVKDGNIKIDWQIDTDGDVINPEVVFSQLPDELFGKCMVEKIKTWTFPEPAVKKYVNHLFRFSDAKGKDGKAGKDK